jgi:hypothetical protein
MVLAQVDGIVYDLTLARTVGAWQSEILARYPTASCSNVPTEAIGLRQQEGQAGRPRVQYLRQLPAAAAIALRRQVADLPDRKTARPLTTLTDVEPLTPCEWSASMTDS